MIASLQKLSLIDYPGKVSCVVFTQGCNMMCDYCHNPDLIPTLDGKYSWGWVKEFLVSRAGKLQAIVFSGGEPTLHYDKLLVWVRECREMNLYVGLHTNGTWLTPELSMLCDYILLSHYTDRKIAIAKKTSGNVDLSKVIKEGDEWVNKIERVQ